MAKFDISLVTQQVDQRIAQLKAAGANMTPAWAAIGNFIVNRIRLGFKFSRDPWGAPWQPIKWRTPRVQQRTKKLHGPTQPGMPSIGITTKRRDKNGKLVLTKYGKAQLAANVAGTPGQPLVDKGILRRSITAIPTTDGVTVGTNLIYARTHQFGATILPKKAPRLVFPGPAGELIFSRRVKVPARPFMPINIAGQIDLPPTWGQNIIRTLAAHFKLGVGTPVAS